MDERAELKRQLDHHLAEAVRLQAILDEPTDTNWVPTRFYLLYHLMAGIILGGIGAAISLLWNIVGSTLLLDEQGPLYIIQVYLTFGMGERALDPSTDLQFALFVGCFLYLATGAVYGMIFQLVLQGLAGNAGWLVRFVVATVLGLLIWGINFYVLLPWIQPRLFGGNWIQELVPPLVGVSTHLVFAWTYALCAAWGRFDDDRSVASVERRQVTAPSSPPASPPTS